MAEEEVHPTERLACWPKAKEIMNRYFLDYMQSGEKGGLQVGGGALALNAIIAGLGEDVRGLAMEPYAAVVAANGPFNVECLEAAERFGFAPDLCAYTRNYWGSIILNKYALGGPFPKPHLRWQTHVCCTHARSETVANRLEGARTPTYVFDVAVGYYDEEQGHKLRYLVDQMHDGIEWLERVTDRQYDDERLIKAVLNEMRSGALWGEICELNKTVPAPLDEKTLFTLQALHTIKRESREVVDFYKELRDEVKDRIARGIAAIPVEKCRLVTTNQPPWAMLRIWRYFEKYGALSVGSGYTFSLTIPWEVDPDGSQTRIASPEERGLNLNSREEALKELAIMNTKIPTYRLFDDPVFTGKVTLRLIQDWHINGLVFHLNRGCEAANLSALEIRRMLIEAGIPVLLFEGSMADERELDEARIFNRIDNFMETMGLKKLQAS